MTENLRVAAKGIISLSISDLPRLGLLSKIELVVNIVTVIGIHYMKGVSIVPSYNIVVGFSYSKPIL